MKAIHKTLSELGLLLESDPKLPSVASLAAGQPVRGSWWGHPQGHAIFRALRELAARPDVLVCKLVSGKVTFVDRKLWPAVVAVGTGREPWQMSGLSRAARSLLDRVTREGRVETSGEAARELERVLLIYSEQIHTEGGAHAKILQSWERWGKASARITSEQGKRDLERAVGKLNRRFGGNGRLPWPQATW
ncbi:MAG: hypothetical protein HY238_25875 [Acidobacteria bacterium]|nr:hypothetical protein [Acidobacteriota bacterium]